MTIQPPNYHNCFVLLDDAREAGRAKLFQNPVAAVTALRVEDVKTALSEIETWLARGFHAAGYLTYEAGLAFEPRLMKSARPKRPAIPLVWFGIFDGFSDIDGRSFPATPAATPSALNTLAPEIDFDSYCDAFEHVKQLIAAGDIYQANLTFRCDLGCDTDPLSIYASLRPCAKAGYGGIVRQPGHWHLSFSPELFFEVTKHQITTRPMKGTARRRADPLEDRVAVDELRADPKQRAENLMIVDLLRNDVSRVARPGTVKVEGMFEVETYPTVHQMVSTIKAEMQAGRTSLDVLRALFPCGSITGAPKIRAMEILGELEASPRGIYTGSIGSLSPDGDSMFNVAIRTLSIADNARTAQLGLGSGVVADSDCEAEWLECLLKGRFADPNAGGGLTTEAESLIFARRSAPL